MNPAEPVSTLVDHLFRRQYGRMVAGLTRVFGPGRLELVEDVVQEALMRALRTWSVQGVPDKPVAWLAQVARNLALDTTRRQAVAARVESDLQHWAENAAANEEPAPSDEVKDDSLRMMFTCCHPALTRDSQVALTLKTLCGFGVGEIARAFLAREATVAQRLSRAKEALRRAEVPFAVPGSADLPDRLQAVQAVLYLMFNEGHAAHRGDDLVRRDLVHEAVRLGELLLELPAGATPDVHALLALMYLQGARLPARQDSAGELLTLPRQDRSLWDREWVARGAHHFDRSVGGDEVTAYHLEAAIALAHATAPGYADTDWVTILRHYDRLQALRPTPVVALNRAVALTKVEGPAAGLRALDALEDTRDMARYHLLPATRGQLLWLLGEGKAAGVEFARAAELAGNAPERAFLQRRAAACARGEAPLEF